MSKWPNPSSKPHDSAHNHVTGKSEYVDDRIIMKNELFCDVILSKYGHAKIKKIDFSKALKEKNIIAGYSGNDFHNNMWGTIFQDQPVLASSLTQYAGEPVAVLVGTNLVDVQYAKSLVEIEYERLEPILSIDDAIKNKSFIGDRRFIKKGDYDSEIKKCENTLSGQVRIQGADHFYLESQATIVYPLEDGQFEVHSSSQHPTETQHVVAHALGVPDKDVVCIVKRMGGGFGGKESQAAPFAAIAALCAQKLNQPVRIALTKDDDMMSTGKRNPFQNDYTVGFDNEGRIQALHVELYSDAGAYADLSTAIMERAMLHCDNAYCIDHMTIEGQVCKTNHHSNTAFRGFGGPKGVATIEKIMEEIAHKLGMDPLDVRMKNLYENREGRNITHYGQEFKNNCLPELFVNLRKQSHYDKKRKEIEDFNKSNDQYIKGMSLTSVKFGISFTTRFLNQANALAIVHQDGTLQVSTGATEMGQGVNSRIAQMVASEMGLDRDDIRMMPTRTDKNANTSPTAASSGTDLNGAAALLAVRKIKYRLAQLANLLFEIPEEKWAKNTAGLGSAPELNVTYLKHVNDPNEGVDWPTGKAIYEGVEFEDGFAINKKLDRKISFKDLVIEAYLNRISLSDYAFYKIPGIEFNKLTGKGDAFLYFTQGCALSCVTLNRDTGELKVDSSDILMDLGRPVNKDLDLGQVSGAFIQGMGWVTSENLFYNDEGLLLSHAPSTYKIPNIQDIPRDYNIDLIENDENYMNVRGTKAVGEPPLLLALSVWAAIQNAMTYLDDYKDQYPQIKIPATNEEILRSIHANKFTQWDNA